MTTSHARALAVAVGAAALLASTLLTAAPASAATSITPTSCAGDGGTFTRVKGVKTCTVTAGTIRYVSETSFHFNTVWGPFSSEFLTAPAYYGEWKYNIGYRDTTITTQKGRGAIATTTVNEVVSRSNYDWTCFSTTDGLTNFTPALVVLCDIAGVYPATIS